MFTALSLLPLVVGAPLAAAYGVVLPQEETPASAVPA